MTPDDPPAQTRRDLFAEAPLVCTPDALGRAEARALARRLDAGLPFARLVECRRGTAGDLVVLEVEVETPQRLVHDIRLVETIAVWFGALASLPESAVAPDIFALREDFPADVPHVNLRSYEYPRSLCLYDVAFAEVQSTWTPARFVALVREWLRLTALGELHASDQPLEPLMHGGCGWIILPNLLRTSNAALGLALRGEIGTMPVFMAVPPDELDDGKRPYVVALVRAHPRTHGVIRRAPSTLADLHVLLSPEDDVREQLAQVLRQWKLSEVPVDAKVAIVVLVPLRRADNALPEIEQPWAFLTVQSIGEIGQSVGLWEKTEYGLGAIIGAAGDGGESVNILPLYAHFDQRREDNARYNGRSHPEDRRFVAIGAGALGSQVLEAFARAAFGQWLVIDSDVLLPHNLARHALHRAALGMGKAHAVVAGQMNAVDSDAAVHGYLEADVLAPGEKAGELTLALAGASAILDMSASVAVARALSRDADSPARRMSLFLNPTGTDVVLLAESGDRRLRLDALEMQYYRAVSRDPALTDSLRGAVARERYGRSCRDVSSQLPHARIATLAGIGAQAVQGAASSEQAAIRVWRMDEDTLAVRAVDVPVHAAVEVSVSEWRVVTDEGLLAELGRQRSERLPNETGGVLLGHVDVARRILYVVDAISSPPDSKEWPTMYIRGAAGLSQAVERTHVATAGQVHYIGEWHSHPRGIPPLPSSDDLQVFAWIIEALDTDDLPAVMLIVSDGEAALFVGVIDSNTRPPVVSLASGAR